MDKLKPTPTLQTKVRREGSAFEIYAFRKLTKEEMDREIALFIIAHRGFKSGRTYKIVSRIGETAALQAKTWRGTLAGGQPLRPAFPVPTYRAVLFSVKKFCAIPALGGRDLGCTLRHFVKATSNPLRRQLLLHGVL